MPLALFVPALHARATALGVHFINEKAVDAVSGSDHITLTTESGLSISAQVLLIADGANSMLRQKLGFAVEVKQLDQMALVAMFDHSGPHHNTSTEFHKVGGPFTTVPMPGGRSSLVWMAKPEKIEALMALPDQAFAAEIQLESHGLLGKISNPTLRKSFAMKTQSAHPLAKARALLIGEAGHQLTPIGAQGLNLSLRDAAVAADLIVGAQDAGSAAICADFDKQRRVEVTGRLAATGFLNSSLMSGFEAMHLARAAGLAAISPEAVALLGKLLSERIAIRPLKGRTRSVPIHVGRPLIPSTYSLNSGQMTVAQGVPGAGLIVLIFPES